MALQPTKASEYRKKKKPFLFKVSDDLTILLKRVDMVSMLVTGGLPMPLLDAADKFLQVRDEIDENTPPEEAIKKLEKAGHDGEFREFLEKYAAYIALEPKISLSDNPPDDQLVAAEMNLLELLAIWNAYPKDEEPAVEVPVPITFRDEERTVSDSSAPASESVRESPQPLVEPRSEFKYQ